MVICLQRDADLHMALLMPLPLTVCCFSKIQIGFTFLVPAHLGSPGKRAVVCVCVVCCITPMNIPVLCMLQAMVVVRVEDMEVVLGKISLVLLHYHMFRL